MNSIVFNDKILRQEGCKQAHPVKLNKKIQIKIHTKNQRV